MRAVIRKILSVFFIISVLMCSGCNVSVYASEVSQCEEKQQAIDTNESNSNMSIPNVVSVEVKKISTNKVRVYFINFGVDTVDSVTATLLIEQNNHMPLTHIYHVTKLSPFINQPFDFTCTKWRTAQIVNAVAIDGGVKGTVGNSPIIKNE